MQAVVTGDPPGFLLVTTRLDRTAGWQTLDILEERLGASVYLLTPDLQARLGLEFVPARVEAYEERVRLQERRP